MDAKEKLEQTHLMTLVHKEQGIGYVQIKHLNHINTKETPFDQTSSGQHKRIPKVTSESQVTEDWHIS